MAKSKKSARTKRNAKAQAAYVAMVEANKEAAKEVLDAVWLSTQDLPECEIVAVAEEEASEAYGGTAMVVTVKFRVPWLDVELWRDGEHLDHPNNKPDDDEPTTWEDE